jgi:integrase/recombinase XerC
VNIRPFLTHLESYGCSPETVRAYRCDLQQFAQFLATRRLRLNRVDFKVIDGYVRSLSDGKKLSTSSIVRRLAGVSAFFDYRAVVTDGKLRNPMRGFRRPRRVPRGPQPVEEATLHTLLAGISNPRDKAIMELFIKSGLRISELQQLDRDTIRVERQTAPDGKQMILGVGDVVGKGNKTRTFLIDEACCKFLSALLWRRRNDELSALFVSSRGTRLSTRAIRQRLHYWCNKLGLPRIRVHRLRHTYATRLANADINTLVLRDLMGHSSLGTTMGYFKIGARKVAREYFAAMELLSGEKR